jgi:hypothetical protein
MRLKTANTTSPVRVIELAGLPGTGKSTIARRLEAILDETGTPLISKSALLADRSEFLHRQQNRLRLIVRNAKQCGPLYRRSLGLIGDTGQRSALDFATVTSNFWSIVALMAEGRASDDRVMVVDQGLVQAIWSVQLSSLKALSLDAWAPILLMAGFAETLLVHVQTDIAVSRQRVSARERSRTRLGAGGSNEQSKRWQVASQNMSNLIEWAQKTIPRDQYGERVITVVNHEGAPEAAAAEIAAAYFKRHPLKACVAGVPEPREGASARRADAG